MKEKPVPFISAEEIQQHISFPELIHALKTGFQQNKIITPERHHHNYKVPNHNNASTLLLMPSWEEGKYLGIKVVTVSPKNADFNLPSIQGTYTLYDAKLGMPLATIDAKHLTAMRTAATSALASSYLSKPASQHLLMIGTGALAPNLIKAHLAVRPINIIQILGRRIEKATEVAKQLQAENIPCEVVSNLNEAIEKADIISSATLSPIPLIKGKYLSPGAHIDLVGAYQPHMREADDLAVQKASVYVDFFNSMMESGDIAIPLEKGIIEPKEIKGELYNLCKNDRVVRNSKKEITLFKSVGHASEYLIAAKLIYEKLKL